MSRRRDDYENSRWRKFRSWVDGEVDLLASGIAVQPPRESADLKDRKPENPLQPQLEGALDRDKAWNQELRREGDPEGRGIR